METDVIYYLCIFINFENQMFFKSKHFKHAAKPLDVFKIVYTANYNLKKVTDIVSTFLRWLPTHISSQRAVDMIIESF